MLRLILLVIFSLKINECTTKLQQVINSDSHRECIKIANFLLKIFVNNNVTLKGQINIAIADYSIVLNTNCIIHKIQASDDRIVFYGATDKTKIYDELMTDYLIFFDEFSENVSKIL
jgi:hypothetical protein